MPIINNRSTTSGTKEGPGRIKVGNAEEMRILAADRVEIARRNEESRLARIAEEDRQAAAAAALRKSLKVHPRSPSRPPSRSPSRSTSRSPSRSSSRRRRTMGGKKPKSHRRKPRTRRKKH
jgi:hypothetical protein